MNTTKDVGPVTAAPAIPGARISNYRNSTPCNIRLVGLGAAGTEAVRGIARLGMSNVAITTRNTTFDWQQVAPVGADLNLLVIVCAEGDEHLFEPAANRTEMPVTFVLLQEKPGRTAAVLDGKLPRARAGVDLFVTTSDADYVCELIANLAS
jgi:hypothetical protein